MHVIGGRLVKPCNQTAKKIFLLKSMHTALQISFHSTQIQDNQISWVMQFVCVCLCDLFGKF